MKKHPTQCVGRHSTLLTALLIAGFENWFYPSLVWNFGAVTRLTLRAHTHREIGTRSGVMHRGEGTEVHCTAIYMKEKKEHKLSYTGFTLRMN